MTCGGVYCSAKLKFPIAKYATDDTRADFFPQIPDLIAFVLNSIENR